MIIYLYHRKTAKCPHPLIHDGSIQNGENNGVWRADSRQKLADLETFQRLDGVLSLHLLTRNYFSGHFHGLTHSGNIIYSQCITVSQLHRATWLKQVQSGIWWR